MINLLTLLVLGLTTFSVQDDDRGSVVVQGRVSSSFGNRTHPITKTERFHSGVDISAPYGTKVYALAAGRVIFSGEFSGYGNVVVLDHGQGVTSHYAHCWATKVKVGDRVFKRSLLGYVGDTGVASGPHLHFEIRRNGKPLDPQAYLGLEVAAPS